MIDIGVIGIDNDTQKKEEKKQMQFCRIVNNALIMIWFKCLIAADKLNNSTIIADKVFCFNNQPVGPLFSKPTFLIQKSGIVPDTSVAVGAQSEFSRRFGRPRWLTKLKTNFYLLNNTFLCPGNSPKLLQGFSLNLAKLFNSVLSEFDSVNFFSE